jgi:hypothetical protein
MSQRKQVLDSAVDRAAGYADGTDEPIEQPRMDPATGRYRAPGIGEALAADMPHVRAIPINTQNTVPPGIPERPVTERVRANSGLTGVVEAPVRAEGAVLNAVDSLPPVQRLSPSGDGMSPARGMRDMAASLSDAMPAVKQLAPTREGISPARYVRDAVMAPGGKGGLMGLGRQVRDDAAEALGKAAYESSQSGSLPRQAAGLVAGVTGGALAGPDTAAEWYRRVSGESSPAAPAPAPAYQGASLPGKDDGLGGSVAPVAPPAPSIPPSPAAPLPGLSSSVARHFGEAMPALEVEPEPTEPTEPAMPRAGGIVRDRKMGIEYRIGDQESGYPISKTIEGQPVAMGGGGSFSVMGGGRNVNPDGSYTYLSADGRGVFTRAPDRNGQLGELLDYRSAGTDAADQAALRAGFGDRNGYRAAQQGMTAGIGGGGAPMVRADTRAVDQAISAFRQRNPDQSGLTKHGSAVLAALLKQRADIIEQANQTNASVYNNSIDRATTMATAGMTDAREREIAGMTDARERRRMAIDLRDKRPDKEMKRAEAKALKTAITNAGGDVLKGIEAFQRAKQPPRNGSAAPGQAQIVSLPNPADPMTTANYQVRPSPDGNGIYAAPIPVQMTIDQINARAAQDAEAGGHTPGFLGFGRDEAERWQRGRAAELMAQNPGQGGQAFAGHDQKTGDPVMMMNGTVTKPTRGALGYDSQSGKFMEFDGQAWAPRQ